MPENKSRFVLACQQLFACAVVGAVAVSALGVVELEIVPPTGVDVAEGGAPDGGSLVSSAPVKPKVRTVELTGGTSEGEAKLESQSPTSKRSPQGNRVVSPAESVTGFATVGVTWDGDQHLDESEIVVEVRTLEGGTWSAWQEMHYDADHGPDAAEAAAGDGEGAEVRQGTEAVVIGDVDDVQVRATTPDGSAPQGLALDIIDPGENVAPAEQDPAIDTATLTSATVDQAQLTAKALSAPKPKIFSRAQWGADERLRDAGSLRYGEIHAGFVHHTVNANSYSKADVPSILRGIYAYHTQSRGWSDVGYNFLVDRFGRIWEGRAGGVAKAVVGAHTLGYNSDSFAMSAVGNFETAQPSQALIDAYAALMAWKLSLHGVDAADDRVYVTSRYFQAINGHRDAGSTACPGRYLYEKLPQIRSAAAKLQKAPTPVEPPAEPPVEEPVKQPVKPGTALQANLSGAKWPDLVVRDRKTKHAVIVRTSGQLKFHAGTTAAPDWAGMDLVTAVGDLDRDGVSELVARSASTGRSGIYAGAKSGTLGEPLSHTRRFESLDQMTGVGDLNGDGRNDVVGRRATNQRLLLFPGTAAGSFGKARVLAEDWSGYDLTTGVDDFNGDGKVDLVTRSGDTLYLVPGTASGVGKPQALAGSWSAFDVIAGRGDATGDGLVDLVTRVDGVTWIYPGDGAGGLTPRVAGFTEHAGMRSLALAGQVVGGKQPDLMGIHEETGALTFFKNSGRKNLGKAFDTGTVLDDVDLILNVGDWNGDGRGDVMTRVADSGVLHFRAGQPNHRLAAPVVAGTGWDDVRSIAAAGDMNGDGYTDLVGRAANGKHKVYPSNGKTGFGRTYVLRPASPGGHQVSMGMWDGDDVPDTALRRKGVLYLWSSESKSVTEIGRKLKRYDWFRGLGDLNGDGRADVVARERKTGHLYLLAGTTDGLAQPRLIGTDFGRYDLGV